MARQKKDGKNISFYMEADIVDRLHAYAEEKGQSLTVATERIIKSFWMMKMVPVAKLR